VRLFIAQGVLDLVQRQFFLAIVHKVYIRLFGQGLPQVNGSILVAIIRYHWWHGYFWPGAIAY